MRVDLDCLREALNAPEATEALKRLVVGDIVSIDITYAPLDAEDPGAVTVVDGDEEIPAEVIVEITTMSEGGYSREEFSLRKVLRNLPDDIFYRLLDEQCVVYF